MIIKVNYSVTDIYMSTSVSPVYVKVVYSGNAAVAGVWGTITGTLSNQTDLQNALNLKVPTSRILTINGVPFDLSQNRSWTISSGTVTSVGLSMPSAFSVANSPITSSGTLAVTANGTAAQYIRGDGQLATLPSGSSGGSSVAYYLNGSVNQGTIGGSVYYEMNKTPVIGTGTDFSKAGNGLIAQFLTDVADPNRLEIPAGNWNFEMYFSASSSGGTPAFYVELLKYDGTTFTSIASSSANPEAITSGTIIDLYLTSLAIPQTTLLSTDRLAIRVYIVNSTGGRTITMHTENSHLCEIITNFAGGVSALNGLTANTQYLATGTSGTDFAISSLSDTHTFNLPTASATNRGALSSADWTTFNGKASGNIYTTSGTLTAARALTLGGFNLDFIGSTHTNRFTSVGRLLLGTTTESTYLLDVNGTARVSGNATINGSIFLANTSNVIAGAAGDGLYLQGQTRTYFYTGTNTFFARGYNGALLVGTTASASDPNASAVLQADSTSKGFLPPRLTSIQRDAISSPATGLSVYNTTTNTNDFYNGTAWTALASGNIYSTSGTLTAARTLTLGGYSLDFIGSSFTNRFTSVGRLLLGTTTESTFLLDVNADGRINGLTIGRGGGSVASNTAIGSSALNLNSTGANNVALGFSALSKNTASNNVGIGHTALTNQTSGSSNIGIGSAAMTGLTTGGSNIGIGVLVLNAITTQSNNVAIGDQAMTSATTSGSVAIGRDSLKVTTTTGNVAIGESSLTATTSGANNTAVGRLSMQSNTTGGNNTSIGNASFFANTTGSNNVAIGVESARFISGGITNSTIQNQSVFIGHSTRPLADNQTNQIVIGYNETGLGSNTTIIGNSSTTLTALRGSLISGGTSVNASAQVQIDSITKGFLPPRMTSTQKLAISSPAQGLMVFDTTLVKLCVYNGTAWETITSL